MSDIKQRATERRERMLPSRAGMKHRGSERDCEEAERDLVAATEGCGKARAAALALRGLLKYAPETSSTYEWNKLREKALADTAWLEEEDG